MNGAEEARGRDAVASSALSATCKGRRPVPAKRAPHEPKRPADVSCEPGLLERLGADVPPRPAGQEGKQMESPHPDHRPSWDEYFMKLANEVATRTTCMRRGVGAVIVKDRRILATGYNGVPTGMRHCAETGCLRQQLGVPSGQRHEICRGLHAEQNAIIQAARYGINITGASIYVNTQPCVVCAKMLINAGIEEIVYQNPYPDELAMSMLEEAGMKLRVFEG